MKKRGRYIKRGSGKPKRGDVIYFYSSAKGRIGHVGIVYKVSGSKVKTKLKEGQDYTLSYSKAKISQKVKVTVKGKGKFKANVTEGTRNPPAGCG